jgi:hypothetical protein
MVSQTSPAGTAGKIPFSRPCGTRHFFKPVPALKCRAIFSCSFGTEPAQKIKMICSVGATSFTLQTPRFDFIVGSSPKVQAYVFWR